MKFSVLVIDDNPANLKLARLVLTTDGFEVETADSAESALATLRERKPHLVLMDIALPGMDGLELARMLRASRDTRHIPIVAMSSYAMKADVSKAHAAGCNGYVTTPTDTRKLSGQLRHLITTAAP